MIKLKQPSVDGIDRYASLSTPSHGHSAQPVDAKVVLVVKAKVPRLAQGFMCAARSAQFRPLHRSRTRAIAPYSLRVSVQDLSD